jgi:hypothetical protein
MMGWMYDYLFFDSCSLFGKGMALDRLEATVGSFVGHRSYSVLSNTKNILQ